MGNIFRKGNTKVSRRVVLEKVTADKQIKIPALTEITKVYFRRTSAGDTTGGVRIGNAAAGAQIVAATALATQNLPVVPALVANGIALTDGTLYISTATSWNGATVDIVIEYNQLGESLPLVVSDSYANGQQGQGNSAY